MNRPFPVTALVFILTAFTFSSCNPSFGYSLKGISIPPNVKTFYVDLFGVQTDDAIEPTLPRDFTEKLKDKIRQESSLQYTDTEPDIDFSGGFTRFAVTAEAPKAGEDIGFNKLPITVSVEFENAKDETANWKKQFTFQDFFDQNENLLDVQEELIENISEELIDQIFNRAFTNW